MVLVKPLNTDAGERNNPQPLVPSAAGRRESGRGEKEEESRTYGNKLVNRQRLFAFCHRVEEQVLQTGQHCSISPVEEMRQTSFSVLPLLFHWFGIRVYCYFWHKVAAIGKITSAGHRWVGGVEAGGGVEWVRGLVFTRAEAGGRIMD